MHLTVILRAGLVAAAMACAALLALPVRAQEAPTPTLSLTGTGEVFATPDRATISSGVVTEDKTARAALDANNEAIAAVIAAIKEAGVEARDIQTSGFSVEPRYVFPKRNDGSEAPEIVGYTVSNTVTVLVRDLDKLGGILDKTVSAGANRLGGISFDVSDADKRRDDARTLAVKDAQRKAEIYATAAGVKLGRILSISESGGFVPGPRKMGYAMRAEAVADVPVETGEQSLEVQVSITWQLEG